MAHGQNVNYFHPPSNSTAGQYFLQVAGCRLKFNYNWIYLP